MLGSILLKGMSRSERWRLELFSKNRTKGAGTLLMPRREPLPCAVLIGAVSMLRPEDGDQPHG